MSTSTTTIVPEIEHKVFVGNLSFKTTKETLTNFAQTSAKVSETTIITRGTRSLGYGFIKFESQKDAEKAAKDLNKQSLEGREINVEVARPKSEEPKKTRKVKNGKKNEKDSEDKPEVKKEVKKSEKVVLKQETLVAEQQSSDEDKTKENAAARKKQNKKNKKRQNKKKSERPPRVFTPSKTTLFVANIPYATTDDDLTKIFKDYKLVSAHIARMKNGRSKGYGFVEFENEEDQLKALNNVKDVVLDTRAIYLKIALSEQKTPTSEEENPIENSEKTREVKTETQMAPEAKVAEVKADKPKTADVKAEKPKIAEVKTETQKAPEAKVEKPKVVEAKPEVKPEVKAEVKPEAKKATEVKAEVKPEAKAEVKPEVKTEEKKATEIKAEPKPEVKKTPEVKIEAKKTEPKTEVKKAPEVKKEDTAAQVESLKVNDTKK